MRAGGLEAGRLDGRGVATWRQAVCVASSSALSVEDSVIFELAALLVVRLEVFGAISGFSDETPDESCVVVPLVAFRVGI